MWCECVCGVCGVFVRACVCVCACVCALVNLFSAHEARTDSLNNRKSY